MAFTLDPHLPLARALRAAALSELDSAIAALDRGGETGVHEARKSCKKLRSWLRLLRGPLGEDYALLNRLLRDAGRQVAGAREADVAQDTLRSLRRAQALDTPRRRKLADALARQGADAAAAQVHKARQVLLTARLYFDVPHLAGVGVRELRAGLGESFRRSREALAAALQSPTAVALHEWRKHAKHHMYQRTLLAPLLAGAAAPQTAALKRLTEALGRHHDLHVLEQQLDALPESGGLQSLRLREAIRARQQRLERQVLRSGEVLFGAAGTVAPMFALRGRRA